MSGPATIAYTPETAFREAPTEPTYKQPGRNITVSELSLQNELQRIRDPDDAQAIEAIAQIVEGALNIEWTLTDAEWEAIVFNSSGATTFELGRAASSHWLVGIDYLDGTADRALEGAIVTQAQLQYTQGGEFRLSLNLIYAAESTDVDISAVAIEKPADDRTHMWHDASLSFPELSSVDCDKLQSVTLTINTNARFQRGGDRHACDAVIGGVETTLTTSAIISEQTPERLQLAYGGLGETEPIDRLDATDATLTLSIGDSPTSEYSLSKLKPDSVSWDDLVDPEADTQDSVEWVVPQIEVTT